MSLFYSPFSYPFLLYFLEEDKVYWLDYNFKLGKLFTMFIIFTNEYFAKENGLFCTIDKMFDSSQHSEKVFCITFWFCFHTKCSILNWVDHEHCYELFFFLPLSPDYACIIFLLQLYCNRFTLFLHEFEFFMYHFTHGLC